jgi:DNA-directed RNA polymerase specialized sigma24 family protein
MDASATPHPRLASPAIGSYRQVVRRFVSRRVPVSDVEDVVQETFCDALASGRAPVDPEELRRWLIAIARFKSVDARRAAARAQRNIDIEIEEPARANDDANLLLRWAERELPKGDASQQTLNWMLREAEGEKLESIARESAMSATAVRQRVVRLRRFLRERWLLSLTSAAVALILSLAYVHHVTGDHAAPATAVDARASEALIGHWQLTRFESDAPLAPSQMALVEGAIGSLSFDYDGRLLIAKLGASRAFGVQRGDGSTLDLLDEQGREFHLSYRVEGGELTVRIASPYWTGRAVLSR